MRHSLEKDIKAQRGDQPRSNTTMQNLRKEEQQQATVALKDRRQYFFNFFTAETMEVCWEKCNAFNMTVKLF